MGNPSYRIRFSYINDARESIIAAIAVALERLSKPEKERLCEELQDIAVMMSRTLKTTGEKQR
ncbi:MAG: hypothetical protein V3T08_02375 [Gemmatimonadota bacterium]